MNSTITIYKNTALLPDRMFKVDSLSTYLAGFTSTNKIVVSNYQYVKHQLELAIKLDSSQTGLEYQSGYNFNYCSIQNGTGKVVYYFILDKKWIAENTIQLWLSMDTLNSFLDDTSLVLSDKTKLIREHKDRFEKSGSYLWPIVDRYTENFQPVLYGGSEHSLEENSLGNLDWFLIYRNQNEPSDAPVNPVDCFIMSDGETYFLSQEKKHIKFDALNVRVSLQNRNIPYVYLIGKFNPTAEIKLFAGSTLVRDWTLSNGTRFLRMDIIQDSGSYYLRLNLYGNDGTLIDTLASNNFDYFDIYDLYVLKYGDDDVHNDIAQAYDYQNLTLPVSIDYTTGLTSFSSDFLYLRGISAVDRTRAELIKIIDCPYCPIPLGVSNTTPLKTYVLPSADFGGAYVSGIHQCIKLNYLGYRFERNISISLSDISSHLPWYKLNRIPVSTITSVVNKSSDLEPKLLHSDFYQPKFIYDSFSYGFKLELMTNYKDATLFSNPYKFGYKVTSTINSRFAFKMIDYVCQNNEIEDYNYIVPVARNNESNIYNQQYINYIRAGYNYDVKNKNRQEAVSWISSGLQVAGAVASYIGAGATSGATLPLAIGLTASSVASITSAISTTIQLETNLEAKQQQLRMQATSVSGSDDIDIMKYYSNNRAKLKFYQVSPRLKGMLFDLFYYTGYICNYLGIPNTTSRSRFNFVQAEPVFKQTPNLPKEIVEDIVNKYKLGFTYIHYYDDAWDFDQVKENWETSLLGV